MSVSNQATQLDTLVVGLYLVLFWVENYGNNEAFFFSTLIWVCDCTIFAFIAIFLHKYFLKSFFGARVVLVAIETWSS